MVNVSLPLPLPRREFMAGVGRLIGTGATSTSRLCISEVTGDRTRPAGDIEPANESLSRG